MKTLRMFEMAFFAVFMCVNFASCSSDDEKDTSLSTKILGEWVSYQIRTGSGTIYATEWKDCGIRYKIKFYSDGHYTDEAFDENGEQRGSGGGKFKFSEDETELYISGDVLKVLISTQALDERPFEPNLFIFSGDFNRMKLWGYKFKRL